MLKNRKIFYRIQAIYCLILLGMIKLFPSNKIFQAEVIYFMNIGITDREAIVTSRQLIGSSASQSFSNNPNQLIINVKESAKKSSQQIILYIPVYVRFMIKNFSNLQLESLNAVVNVSLLIAIYTEGMGPNMVEAIKDNLHIHFRKDGTLKVIQQGSAVNYSDVFITKKNSKDKFKVLNFTIRKFMNTKVEPFIFLTPFDVIDLILSFQFRKITLYSSEYQEKQIVMKFQCMECSDQSRMFNFSIPCIIGNYHLAEKRIIMELSTQSTPKSLMKLGKNHYTLNFVDQRRQIPKELDQEDEQKQQTKEQKPLLYNRPPKQEYVQNVHIHMPVYRYPGIPLFLVFIPLCSLNVINLAIYFQQPALGDRISSIANLLIAFLALIPGIRQQIPPSSLITMLQILVFIDILISMLCLFQSLAHRQDDQKQYVQFYDPYADPLFLASLSITILMFVIPFITYIIHRIYLKSHRLGPFPKLKTTDQDFSGWDKNTAAQKWLENLKNRKTKSKILYELEGTQEFKTQMGLIEKVIESSFREKQAKKKRESLRQSQRRIKAQEKKKEKVDRESKRRKKMTHSRVL